MTSPTPTRPPERLIAALAGDIVGSRALPDQEALALALRTTAERLNAAFQPVLAEPFAVVAGDELRGALSDAVQAPLCVAVMRETLAPVMVRVGVAVTAPAAGAVEAGAFAGSPAKAPASTTDDVHALALATMALAKEQGLLLRYAVGDDAGEPLLRALCRFLDPLLRARTAEQWAAVDAYRRTGETHAAARLLQVSEDELVKHLSAAHWQLVEEADAAIAAYLARLAR